MVASFCLRLPRRLLSRRSFASTATRSSSNPLFNLQGLSTSRESQWLSKASGLSRIEHSPGLQLLRSEAELQRAASQGSPALPERPDTTKNVARSPTSSAEYNQPSTVSFAATVKPWMGKIRRDLDDLERAMLNHGGGTAQANAGWTSLEKSYTTLIRKQEQMIATLNETLQEEQSKHTADLRTWAAVKTTINNHKERAETAGALSIVLATVFAVMLYYQRYSVPDSPRQAEPSTLVRSQEPRPAILDTSNEPAPAHPSTPLHNDQRPVEETQISELSSRGLFWSR